MALNHSAKIVTDGLVFYYDMNNQKKSFLGGPHTNSYWNSGSPFAPWTAGGVNTDITGTDLDDGPIRGAKTYKFSKTGTSNQWNGWEGIYGNTWTGSAGDIWTTSYWYKTVAPAGLSSFVVGNFYLSDWSRAYSSTILSNRNSIIADGKWRFNYTTTQINEAYTNAIIVDGPAWGYSTSAGTLYINGLTWTKQAYAPPPYSYTFGTRSNTQAILDLTGNNTVTANSLTYASDGSFSFNGSSNYITVSASSNWAFGANGTIEQWVYINGNSGTNNRFWCVTNNSSALDAYLNAASYNVYFHGGTVGTTTTIPTSQWVHLVVTYTSGTIAVYFNGVAQGLTGTTTGYNLTNNSALFIGQYSGGGNYYLNGRIGVTKVYNRALSAAEVRQNFNALRGRYGI